MGRRADPDQTRYRVSLDISDLVAAVGIAPRAGQVPTNHSWGRAPVTDSQDLKRIKAIPRRPQPGPDKVKALIQHMTATFRRDRTGLGPCRCHAIRPDVDDPCIIEFRMAQSWALFEMGLAGGLLGSIGVGHGKTLLDIMSPMAMPDCKIALLLVKPDLVTQLIEEYELINEHFNVPSLIVHGREWSNIIPGRPQLHVLPLSLLCRKTCTDFIPTLNPDFIIIDEVQKVSNRDTATARRVFRYARDNWERTRFAGWTGTLSDKSLNEYGHIAAFALGMNSPLPLDPQTLDEWARAIDPGDNRAPAGALFQLCEPGEHVESGYRRRLTETLGVIATKKAPIDAHLIITERRAPPIPHTVRDALETIRGFVRPDGEELVEAWEVARCARQAACGFFYHWTFPRGETEEQINVWLSARQAWNRELREKLRPGEEFLDSPLLCEEAARRAWTDGDVDGPPSWRADSWPAWGKVKGTVRPKTEPVWIDDFLAQDAAEWGRKNRGVIWYNYGALGQKIGEISGFPVHGGGPKAAEIIAREKGDRSIIASIHAHGTGRDGLQRLFVKQLVTSPPGSGKVWEQLLGRLHRIGQDAAQVFAEVYRHTEEFRWSIDQAMARALYVQDTLGSEQKLRMGYNME